MGNRQNEAEGAHASATAAMATPETQSKVVVSIEEIKIGIAVKNI